MLQYIDAVGDPKVEVASCSTIRIAVPSFLICSMASKIRLFSRGAMPTEGSSSSRSSIFDVNPFAGALE